MPSISNSRLILTPSWSGFCGCLVFAGLVVTAVATSSQNGGLLYQTLFGSNAPFVTATTDQFETALGNLSHTIFDSSLSSRVLFITFWAFVGLVVYGIIYFFQGSYSSATGFRRKLHYVNADPGAMQRGLLVRLSLLGASLVLWVIYSLVLVRVILPVSISQINQTIGGHSGPLNIIFGTVLLIVYCHIGIVMLRFTLLRPRLFGSR